MPVSYCCHQIMWTALESLVSLLRIKRWEGTDHLYWRESGCSTSERRATRGNLNWWRALLPSTSAIPPRGKTLWHCLQTQFNFELLQIRIFFSPETEYFKNCSVDSVLVCLFGYVIRKRKKAQTVLLDFPMEGQCLISRTSSGSEVMQDRLQWLVLACFFPHNPRNIIFWNSHISLEGQTDPNVQLCVNITKNTPFFMTWLLSLGCTWETRQW